MILELGIIALGKGVSLNWFVHSSSFCLFFLEDPSYEQICNSIRLFSARTLSFSVWFPILKANG